MFTLTPGNYKAFAADGTRITWGGETLRFVVTMDNELKLFTGDNSQPLYVSPIIRKGFKNKEEFQSELTTLAYQTILHYTMGIIDKLDEATTLMSEIRAGRQFTNAQYMSKRITAEKWEEDIKTYHTQEYVTREYIHACCAEIKRMDPTAEIIIEDL